MSIEEKELLVAVQKSVDNSIELISDADLLKDNQRTARAYTLYQLTMEEAGKAMDIYASIILNLISTKEGQKKLKNNFFDHVEKAQRARMLSVLLAIELIKTDKKNGETLLLWTIQEIKDAELLNNYKNYSLYTSFFDGTYRTPKEIISLERLNYIEVMAKSRVTLTKKFIEISLANFDVIKEYSFNNPMTEEKREEAIKKIAEESFSNDLLQKLLPIVETPEKKITVFQTQDATDNKHIN